MPQFVAQARNLSGLDDMVSGYLECAEFADLDEKDSRKPIRGWSRDAKRKAARAVKQFLDSVSESDLNVYREGYGPRGESHGYSADECIGHDIWYDSQGHGVGFYDRATHKDSSEFRAACERLSAAARNLRLHEVWRGSSGWLHLY
jgi:hypothetical protein